MSVAAHWSPYALNAAWLYITGQEGAPAAPTTFTARLYSTTANPTFPPVESTLGGYAPIAVAMTFITTEDDLIFELSNTDDVSWNDLSAGTITGLGITDDNSGEIMWWVDFPDGPIDTSVLGGILIPAGQFFANAGTT